MLFRSAILVPGEHGAQLRADGLDALVGVLLLQLLEVRGAGLHVKIPFLERVAKKVSLKEQVADFPPQPVITRDNVTMQIDTVVFFQVMDAKLYTYGVNQPIAAIESLSATTLRNIIGEMELDHTLTSRDTINSKITAILDEATDKIGRAHV